MKTLDMADKYPPAESFEDEDPTIKVQVPNFEPKVIVENDIWGERDTIPCPPPYPQPYVSKGVNGAAISVLVATIAFWASITYFLFR